MAEPTDITVTILREIRDEIRETRDEIRETRDQLGARIDRNGDRIDQLAQETTRGFTLVADHLRGLEGRVDETNAGLGRVEGHLDTFHAVMATRTTDLERRMARVESHLGLDD